MKLTLFILEYCPFCKRARQYIKELKEEYPEFQSIEIEIIDEEKQKELADSYDYYYVPTFYLGKQKLHEAGINKDEVKAMFQSLLKKA
jgi:glutaredoxin